jgi:hypothetical protein
MDSSSEGTYQENTDSSKEEPGEHLPHDRNVFQPLWVRCAFRVDDGVDRFLLDYGLNFLLPIGIILWTLLLFS